MGTAKIHHKGKVIERKVDFLTPEEIARQLESVVGANRRLMVRRGASLIPLDRMTRTQNLGGEAWIKDLPAETTKGAISRRERFIKAQVASVADVYGQRYGQTVQLHESLDFVVIPNFSLPARWGMKTTPILIWFPQEYPEVAPNGFYLSQNCRGPHIFSRNVYGKSPDYSARGWNWYCVHTHWSPKADPLEEDNLWTFLEVIRVSLTIREF